MRVWKLLEKEKFLLKSRIFTFLLKCTKHRHLLNQLLEFLQRNFQRSLCFKGTSDSIVLTWLYLPELKDSPIIANKKFNH